MQRLSSDRAVLPDVAGASSGGRTSHAGAAPPYLRPCATALHFLCCNPSRLHRTTLWQHHATPKTALGCEYYEIASKPSDADPIEDFSAEPEVAPSLTVVADEEEVHTDPAITEAIGAKHI